MVNFCCVKGCKNEAYPGSPFSFHRFPTDDQRRAEWIKLVPGHVTKYAVICSAHFKTDDYLPGIIRRVLKSEAVPSIFPVVAPPEKQVLVLSDIRLVDPEPGPAPKKIKLHESVCTQTSSQTNASTPRKKKLTRDIKVLKQRLQRRGAAINNLKSLLKLVKKKCDNYDEVEQIIQMNFQNIHTKLNATKSSKGNRYSDDLKSFALSLYYYSGKSYLFLRNHISLPHPATLRRILATHKCNVGFMTEVIEFIKVKAAENENIRNVALIFDAMAIKVGKQYDQSSDKYWGGIDLGGIVPNDPEIFAKEALVFQIVSLKEKFVCPIGYFFIDKISADLQAQLVMTAIRMLAENNIIVRTLTADGTRTNKSTFEKLGCDFTLAHMKTHFDHPTKSTKVYCILDPAHMIKLARNVFGETSLSSEKGDIKFEFVRKLQKLQEEEGLKLKNKLTKVHVNFFGKKMNVRLAAQVLSSSVADSIEYLRRSGHPSFSGSEATVEYLRYLDRIFDIFNVKNPIGKGFKSPLRLSNQHVWMNVFEETRNYLSHLRINGTNIMAHSRNTPALGLIIDTYSFTGLASDLLGENVLEYLLTYKCSQDHIEMLFSCVRARGGSNDNPNALQFMYIMRKLLFRNSIRPSLDSNCMDPEYETTPILEFRSAKRSTMEESTAEEDNEQYSEVLIDLMGRTNLSDFKNNILYYISGFIVRKIIDKMTCQNCRSMLVTNKHNDHNYIIDICEFSSFTVFVDKGGLKYASKFVYDVVQYIEKMFLVMSSNLQNLSMRKMQNLTVQHFASQLKNIFPPHLPRCEEFHELELIKIIAQNFLNLRLKTYAKSLTLKNIGHRATLRQKLRKTILFSNV